MCGMVYHPDISYLVDPDSGVVFCRVNVDNSTCAFNDFGVEFNVRPARFMTRPRLRSPNRVAETKGLAACPQVVPVRHATNDNVLSGSIWNRLQCASYSCSNVLWSTTVLASMAGECNLHVPKVPDRPGGCQDPKVLYPKWATPIASDTLSDSTEIPNSRRAQSIVRCFRKFRLAFAYQDFDFPG